MRRLVRGTTWLLSLVMPAAGCLLADPAPTWHADVAPVVAANCQSCHGETGIGGFPLETYAQAKPLAGLMALATQDRRMPPWLPEPTMAFRHARRLTDAEITIIGAWAAAGAPEGDEDDAPPPVARDLPAVRVDAEVTMKTPYAPDPATTDDYRCFVLDPELTYDRAVTGFDVRPGNPKIVHHVILYAVEEGDLPRLAELEAGTPGEGYTCFGGAGLGSATMVGGWVPGTTATVFPTGTGVVLSAGSKLVMQVHYNTLEVKDAVDQTTALLEYAPADDVRGAYILPILDSEFVVPPGEVKTVTHTFDGSDFDVPEEITIEVWGVLPHMHLHGQSIRVTVEKQDGSRHDLVKIPRWDFQWQQFYFFEEPFEVRKGDTLTLECVFDNRAESQPIVNGQRTEPAPLTWGEGTLEEMCLNFFYATIR